MPVGPPVAIARDAGLVQSIGPFALFAAFIGTLLGSAVFVVPATMASAVGPWAPLAYLGCGLAVGTIMLAFAEAASRVPTSGGVSGFVAAALGPYWGFLTGGMNWASAVVAAGGIAAAAADVIGTVVPALAAGPVRVVAIIGWFAFLATINARGAGFASRFAAFATSIKVIPVLIFIGVGLWFIVPANLSLPLAGGHADIGRAAILGIFLFTGAETSMAVCGEVRDPARTVPRALIAAIFGYAIVCILVQVTAQGLLGNALATSPAPLAQGMRLVAPGLGALLVAGTVISMLGWTASDALASPRMIFAMARDGFLPARLGDLDDRSRAPVIACYTHAGIAAALAISGSFAALAVLSTLILIGVYFIGTFASLKLRAEGAALAGPPVRIPGLPLIAVFGVGALVWVTAQSTRNEALAVVGYIALLSLVYRFRRLPDQASRAAA